MQLSSSNTLNASLSKVKEGGPGLILTFLSLDELISVSEYLEINSLARDEYPIIIGDYTAYEVMSHEEYQKLDGSYMVTSYYNTIPTIENIQFLNKFSGRPLESIDNTMFLR